MTQDASTTTAKVRRVWDRQAKGFDRQMAFWERRLFEGDRAWACGQARGDVLEVAVGTGRNLEHYPADVRLVGVDLSSQMLARARARARGVRPDADLRQADAQDLPFDDASFDTVVCTYSLCSVPDDRQVVGEMARVLRPGGQLILAEHVGSSNRWVRAVQWLLHQVTYRLAHEHQLRQPYRVVLETGLEPTHHERRKAGIAERLTAQKPSTGQL